jgi:hypothetical protein
MEYGSVYGGVNKSKRSISPHKKARNGGSSLDWDEEHHGTTAPGYYVLNYHEYFKPAPCYNGGSHYVKSVLVVGSKDI